MHALFERLIGFEVVRRHGAAIAPVNDHGFRAESFRRARRIHCGIAAAVNRDAATQHRRIALIGFAQETHGIQDLARFPLEDIWVI